MTDKDQTPPQDEKKTDPDDPIFTSSDDIADINYGKLSDPMPPCKAADEYSRSKTFNHFDRIAKSKAAHIRKHVAQDEFFLSVLIALRTAGLTFAIIFSLIHLYSDETDLFLYFMTMNGIVLGLVVLVSVWHLTSFPVSRREVKFYIRSDVLKSLVQETLFAGQRMGRLEPTVATDGLLRLMRIFTEHHLLWREIWLIWIVIDLKIKRVQKTAFYAGLVMPIILCLLPLALRTGEEMVANDKNLVDTIAMQFSQLAERYSTFNDAWMMLLALFVSGLMVSLSANIALSWIMSRIKKVLDLKNEEYYYTDVKDRIEVSMAGGDPDDCNTNPRYQFYPYSFDMTATILRNFFHVQVDLKRHREAIR